MQMKTLVVGMCLVLCGVAGALSGCIGSGGGGRGRRVWDRPELYIESCNLKIDKNNDGHIIWAENNETGTYVYYTKIDMNGKTLIDDVLLQKYEPPRPTSYHKEPDLGVDSSGNVHVTFDLNNCLYYGKLDPNGKKLFEPYPITESDNRSTDSDLLVDRYDNVHVVWTDWRDGFRKIMYTKMTSNGDYIIWDKVLSGNDAVDASIAMDSNELVYVSWISKSGFDPNTETESGAGLCYVRLDHEGSYSYRRYLSVFGDSFDQYSLEMCINSRDQLAFTWSKDGKLTYFPMTHIGSYRYVTEKKDKKMEVQNEFSYTTNIDGVNPKCKYFLSYNISKHLPGSSEGDILISRNGDTVAQLHSWDYERWPKLRYQRYEFDITKFVTGSGKYDLIFKRTGGFVDPDLRDVEIILYEMKNWTRDISTTLTMEDAFEPSIVIDPADNIHLAWYNSTEGAGSLNYMTIDYEGRIIRHPRTLGTSNATIYDPSIALDSNNHLWLVWFDERKDTNGLYFMRMDQSITKQTAVVRISNDRELEYKMLQEEQRDQLDREKKLRKLKKAGLIMGVAVAAGLTIIVLSKRRRMKEDKQ